MRIITIDNGNTNPHVGIFQNQKLNQVVSLIDFIPLNDDFILISDVGEALPFKPSIDLKLKRHYQNNTYTFFDMPINYQESIGDDRLISAYYLFKTINKPDQKILLIDAGTFITFDLISINGLLGGYIFPGIGPFLSCYQQGAKLKVINFKKDFKILDLPHSTEDAVLGALDCYLESTLKEMIKKTKPQKIVITGGNLELINHKIIEFNLTEVPLEINPHLIHLSLHSIFQNHLRPKAL